MPIHDWARVPAGLFHEFHQSWCVHLKDALNDGVLSDGYSAQVERRDDSPDSDVAVGRPRERALTRVTLRAPSEAADYASRANRILIRDPLGEVAVIEIVSPGHKESRTALRSFVEKAVALLRHRIHLLVVDLFPSVRASQGIHAAIWDEFSGEPFDPPPDKPLTLVSYQAGRGLVAHLEPVAVGDTMPDMPLFLTPGGYVPVPLEAAYQETWAHCPAPIRELVQLPA